MDPQELPLPPYLQVFFSRRKITQFTPVQQKALTAGVREGTSLLVCSPTASGKTLIATLAISTALEAHGKAIYLVPLKALASEKFLEYQELFKETPYSTVRGTGDVDDSPHYYGKYDLLILTVEKLDALLRHGCPWLPDVKTVIIDETHLLNDPKRGPTLEIVITLLKTLIQPQFIALSATIGNPQELANWLGATLVTDSWRPVQLKHGVYYNKETEFFPARLANQPEKPLK